MCWGQQFFRGRRETVAVCVEPSRLGVSIAGTWHCAKNCLSFPFWWVVPSGIFAFIRELQHISSAVALTLFTLNMYYVAFILSVALFKIVFTLSLDSECTKQMSILNFSPLRQCLQNGEQNITYDFTLFRCPFLILCPLRSPQTVRKEMDFISGEEWPTLSLLGLVFLSFSRGTKAFLSVAEFAHHFQILLLLLLSLSRHRCELPRFSLPCVGCIFFLPWRGSLRLDIEHYWVYHSTKKFQT